MSRTANQAIILFASIKALTIQKQFWGSYPNQYIKDHPTCNLLTKEIFPKATPIYSKALEKSGFNEPLVFTPKTNTSNNTRKKQRKRKIIGFKSPFSINVKTNDCMFLSCHVRVSEWIHTLSLPECQGTPCSKQARNDKNIQSNAPYR